MQLAPMRYTRIEGTAVAVTVTSAAEAKAALKELRHKKRELKFLRTALARRQRAARARQSGAGKPRRSLLRRALAGLGSLIAWLFEVATVPRAERRARNPAEIARELQRIDETLHNVEGCIVQLQGKMLTLGGG
ncbi:MAG: hypothetical protein K2X43_05360 [Hyphomonadaceae bacterium]|nr:hypothetical protein [Hyphomonadaceae bacterium]